MTVKTTKIVLEAEAKGFDRVRRDVDKTMGALNVEPSQKAFKFLNKQVGDLGVTIKSLVRDLSALNVAGKSGAAGMTAEFEKMRVAAEAAAAASVAAMNAGNDPGQRRKNPAKDPKNRPHRRGFAMGVMQGSGLGEYFPDEGLRANVAGRVAGRVVGGLGRSGAQIMGSAFTGSQGVAQGLGGIPVVGGFLSGLFQNGMAAAQEALAFREQARALVPFQSGRFDDAGRQQAAWARANPRPKPVTEQQIKDASLAYDEFPSWDRASYTAPSGTPVVTSTGAPAPKYGGPTPSGVLRDTLGEMESQGSKFGGMSSQASLDFGKQLMQFRGGNVDDMMGDDFFKTAAAAQGRFGIGADTSGAFARGQHHGAFGGSTSAALARTMSDGMKLGLEGSDLQNMMRQVAQTLMDFDQSGMPIDPSAITGFGLAVARAGVGGTQGSRVGQGLLERGRQIATHGVQSPADMLMLRELFGYEGGGLEDMLGAMKRAEGGDLSGGKGIGSLVKRVATTGSRAGDTAAVHDLFNNRFGVSLGYGQSEDLLSGKSAGLGGGGMSAQDIQNLGAFSTDPALQRQHGMERTRRAAGDALLPAAQNFEQITTDMLKNFSSLSPHINAFSNKVAELSKSSAGIWAQVDRLLNRVEDIVSAACG